MEATLVAADYLIGAQYNRLGNRDAEISFSL